MLLVMLVYLSSHSGTFIFLAVGEHSSFQSKLNLREKSKTENKSETSVTI